jgi:hypothetical protein
MRSLKQTQSGGGESIRERLLDVLSQRLRVFGNQMRIELGFGWTMSNRVREQLDHKAQVTYSDSSKHP